MIINFFARGYHENIFIHPNERILVPALIQYLIMTLTRIIIVTVKISFSLSFCAHISVR
jgi:hypothetical protein